MRLWIASALTWSAAHIAPRVMRPVFLAYCGLLRDFPEQVRMGRTYGIATAQWFVDRQDQPKCERLQRAAVAAATRARGRLYKAAIRCSNDERGEANT